MKLPDKNTCGLTMGQLLNTQQGDGHQLRCEVRNNVIDYDSQ